MLLKIHHTTHYQYTQPVSHGLQRLRLTPKSTQGQQVLSWNMDIKGGISQVDYEDHNHNRTTLITVEPGVSEVLIHCDGVVQTADNAGIIGHHAGHMPLWAFLTQSPLTRPGPRVRALMSQLDAPRGDVLASLHALSRAVIGSVSYVIGATHVETTAEEAAAIGSGVCQDHAHIFIGAARALGIPARYVSGYLMMDDRIDQEAGHAWAEAHVEGLGWVGFDVSNAISPDARYVRVATGRDYREAAPVTGVSYGAGDSSLQVRLAVEQQIVEQQARGGGEDQPVTYCVGMTLDKGLVLMSDTRTNSGVDNISTFRKMFHWSVPGERIISIMTAGNLATTQAVISQLEERTKAPDERRNSLLEAPTMFQVAGLVGKLLCETIKTRQDDHGEEAASTFTASIILAGQIKGMEPRLFLIYPEGNFIEASFDTPFFQIGETKYGRPILIRGYDAGMSFEDAVKLLMVSFDSTLAANLSVGLPLDLLVLERDRFEPLHQRRITAADPYFRAISSSWSEALKNAFHSLPDYSFYLDKPADGE